MILSPGSSCWRQRVVWVLPGSQAHTEPDLAVGGMKLTWHHNIVWIFRGQSVRYSSTYPRRSWGWRSPVIGWLASRPCRIWSVWWFLDKDVWSAYAFSNACDNDGGKKLWGEQLWIFLWNTELFQTHFCLKVWRWIEWVLILVYDTKLGVCGLSCLSSFTSGVKRLPRSALGNISIFGGGHGEGVDICITFLTLQRKFRHRSAPMVGW